MALNDVKTAVAQLTALVTDSWGTISTTKLRRVGLSNAMVTPPNSAVT